MIIKNRIGKVEIHLENVPTTKNTYTIKNLNNCLIVSQGILPTLENNTSVLDLKLDDGNYELSLSYQSLPEHFTVHYNFINNFVTKFKKIICDCFTCKKDETALDKLFFETISFLNYTGYMCTLKSTKYLDDCYKTLSQSENTKKIFGKFTFDYKDKITTFLILIFLEIYQNEYENYPTDIDDINTMFSIDIIEKCLNNKGIDFNYILTLSKNYRCQECGCN